MLFAQVSPAPTPTPNAPAEPDQTPNAERTEVRLPGEPPPFTANSYYLDNYPLNDLYEFLARQADLQYFHSQALDPIKVTGQLFKGGDPVESMHELALQYNLVLYQRGRTIYAMTQDQIANLPQQEFRYELKYLRPTQDDVQRMLQRFLTFDPATGQLRGSVGFEPKVNTIVVLDNESAIRRISTYLSSIDRPRRQIAVQVRVISIDNSANKGTGVDWSNTLGPNGLSLTATAQASMNSLFGFDLFRQALSAGQSLSAPFAAASSGSTSSSSTSGSLAGNFGNPTATTVTLGPVQVNAILRALYGNNRVSIENAPLVVTEDNEPANVSVVTRTPIVTSNVTVTNGVTDITSEVRYQIDLKDKTDPPQDRREIGTTLAVIPTVLPDGTIRLLINGTVATQVGTQSVTVGNGASPNLYPIINEAHIANLARLPAGYSLILGGFVNESMTEARNKVPVLGNIPLLGYAFRSTNYIKQRTNLVFIFTPTAYDAKSPQQAVGINEKNRQDYSMRQSDNYADPNDPKHNADVYPPELRNALASPEQEVDTNPLSDRNPKNRRALPVTTKAQQKQKELEERYHKKGPVPLPTP
jgi:type II secretory pathway component GspD/PulD (secretin)